nr:ribonuclease H-like domain-containing protein [Tanacetum cinerariifolium]
MEKVDHVSPLEVEEDVGLDQEDMRFEIEEDEEEDELVQEEEEKDDDEDSFKDFMLYHQVTSFKHAGETVHGIQVMDLPLSTDHKRYEDSLNSRLVSKQLFDYFMQASVRRFSFCKIGFTAFKHYEWLLRTQALNKRSDVLERRNDAMKRHTQLLNRMTDEEDWAEASQQQADAEKRAEVFRRKAGVLGKWVDEYLRVILNLDIEDHIQMFVGSQNSSSFTPEQMKKLLSLINETASGSVHANMTGKASFFNANVWFNINFSKYFCGNNNLYVKTITLGWIIDSGANQHLTVSTVGMSNIVDISNLKITVGHPNGTLATASHVGNLKVTKNVILLGHPADQVLADVSACEVCHRAKQTRESFPLSDHNSKKVRDIIHLDL